VLFCGEVVTASLLERCYKIMPWVQFVNLYSVSEAHDIACSDLTKWYQQNMDQVKDRKFCPVGKLLPGVSVIIMDDNLQPQPVGVSGEIYIGGPTLAIGYLNRPEITKMRFIDRPNSVSPKIGDRLYKSGDWGYMLSDGSFEICGRCDSMVKIRGYSIEIQAVEASLLELSIVNNCVVVVNGEEGEDKFLVAYIVPEGGTTKKEVRAALKKRLPFYMIPSYFVFLSVIPIVAATGKLDKKALPSVDKNTETDNEGAPSTDMEKELAGLWADVLRLKNVDVTESFFDLGGHSLLATKLLSKIHEKFGIQLAVKDLFIHSTVFCLAKLLEVKLGDGSSDEEGSLSSSTVDFMDEVDKHDLQLTSLDIQLRAFWRSMQYGDRWNKARVLITGATGFLGSFILRDLLEKTKTHIFCLVRETPEIKGMDRIKEALVKFGIIPKNSRHATDEQASVLEKLYSRVTPVAGDVGLINMGVSEEDYMYLSTEVDFIIHAAAYVNLIYPYQALHGPNVLGTQNVILFACTSKIKPLHYVSTDAVFPHGLKECSEDDDMTLHANSLEDGYSQSKWVAEQLVLRAMGKGLPAAIYRPGNLSGDSDHAYWNPQDFNLLMLKGCLRSGYAPDMKWDVEMTPVNFVSNFIVTLTQKMALGLRKVYHVINTQPIKSSWLFEWISAHGYPLKMVSYSKWIQHVEAISKSGGDGMLKRLIDGLAQEECFFANLSTYTNRNVQNVLRVIEETYPEINNHLLRTYFTNLARRRVLPPVRRNTTYPYQSLTHEFVERPLEGHVAVVTGASSGIGAAIGVHLARAGAMVAMAARREDQLLELKKSIERDGGVAIAVKTDILKRDDITQLIKHTECTLGPVDILVNNAGVMYYTMMKNLNEEQWHRQIDLNCKGMMNCIAGVLDSMINRNTGHIINMSSDAGRRGFAGLAVYSGTKFFVEGVSQGMRHELAPHGIKVTCIQPGDVKTELQGHSTDKEAQDQYDGSQNHPVLEADDIGRAVVYAATQPPYASVNEILIEPRAAPI